MDPSVKEILERTCIALEPITSSNAWDVTVSRVDAIIIGELVMDIRQMLETAAKQADADTRDIAALKNIDVKSIVAKSIDGILRNSEIVLSDKKSANYAEDQCGDCVVSGDVGAVDGEKQETPLDRLRSVVMHLKLAQGMAEIQRMAAGGERVFMAIGYEGIDGGGQITARLDLGPFLDDLAVVVGEDNDD